MKQYATLFVIASLFLSLMTIMYGDVPSVKAADIFHDGDLILSGNNVTIIDNQILHINGSILITENATLIVRNNGGINFTQQYSNQFNMTLKDPANGNPRLIIEDYSGITGGNYFLNLHFYDNSTLEAHEAATSEDVSFFFEEYSVANIENCELYEIYMYGSATLNMTMVEIWRVNLYGYSKATISNTDIYVELYAGVYSEITLSNCVIHEEARARHYAKCYIYDSVITNATSYDDVIVWLFNTTVTNGAAYNNSIVYMYYYLDVHVTDFVGQDVPSANVTAYDAEDFIVESKLTGPDGKARLALMIGFANETSFYWTGAYTVVTHYMDCSNSTAVDMYGNTEIEVKLGVFYSYPANYDGDIILKDNECLCVNGLLNINGSIIAEENATLIVHDGWINFTQEAHGQFNMTIRGSAKLTVENGNITSNNYSLMAYIEGNSIATIDELTSDVDIVVMHYSTATIFNSNIKEQLAVLHFANVSASHCTIEEIVVSGNTTCSLSNCTIKDYVSFDIKSANATIMDLTPGHINSWNLLQDCMVEVDPDGLVSNLTITDTEVSNWLIHFIGSSNASIFRSTLMIVDCRDNSRIDIYNSNITIYISTIQEARCRVQDTNSLMLFLYDNSKIWAYNVTTPTAPNIFDNAKLYVGWWLKVHVIDQADQDVPDANVTIKDSEGHMVAYGKTQSNGWANFLILKKIVNATGTEYEFGEYTVEADYEGNTNSAPVTMDGNKEVIIPLPFTLPEFTIQIMLAALIALTLATMLYKRRQNRK